MAIAAEDYTSISDHLAHYCQLVDEGDADNWVKLWCEDGVASLGGGKALVGHERLKLIVKMSEGENPGMLRHMVGNLHCDYGDTRDAVIARFYNLVTDWAGGGALKVLAVCEALLLRNGDGWLVKRNDGRLLGV